MSKYLQFSTEECAMEKGEKEDHRGDVTKLL
jgi:hypothetical protein